MVAAVAAATATASDAATARAEIHEHADSVWTHGDGGARNGRRPRIDVVGREALRNAHGRVAIVDGCRTPFIKAGTEFRDMDVVDLAGAATAELVARTNIDPTAIELAVFGVVVPALNAPNLGR